MEDKTVVSWATMIGVHAQWDQPNEAVRLFDRLIKSENVRPNEVTLVNVLAACARARDVAMVKRIHEYIDEHGFGCHVVLNTALMDVYCKCGCVKLARDLFDKAREKSLFSWNIMINGHVEDNNYEEALLLFREMQTRGIKGDKVTMAGLVLACTHLGALELGKWCHACIMKQRIQPTVEHYGGLVDMLGRAGRIADAEELIESMPMAPDHFVLGGLLGACRIHGNLEAAERAAKQLLDIDPYHSGTVDGSTNPHALFPTKTGHSSG
ncbi:REPEAT-CONTAINING PROTEIN putative-RELATED [Salix purpurea]|uniref:REPEAT-CONTAINING PROTEIN putative-RELATED n=1 Tax=Salix purpurea TaxID=77065 RepID=A0A9Q0UK23_SALPP|nr:REPEAT-CONTAINING PROTEIN putative-RELATED [Salix purpurea]